MAIDLGTINVQKYNQVDPVKIQNMLAQKQALQQAQSQVQSSPEYSPSNGNSFGRGLAMMAMGIGEGMTGRPFLTNFANNLYEQKQAQLKYKQWQEEQKIAQQKADIELLSKMQGSEVSYAYPTTGKIITSKIGGMSLPNEITAPVYQRLGMKNPPTTDTGSMNALPEGMMAVKEGGKVKLVNAPKGEKVTDTQKITATYAQRLIDSENAFKRQEKFINNQTIKQAVGGMLPPELSGLKGKDLQQYEQAKRSFLNAVLRKESGAVISPSEFREGNAQYFPMYGDDPLTIEQKRKNRETVISGFVASSGDALKRLEKVAETRGIGAKLDTTDPRVKKALDAGYKPEEINAFLNKGK